MTETYVLSVMNQLRPVAVMSMLLFCTITLFSERDYSEYTSSVVDFSNQINPSTHPGYNWELGTLKAVLLNSLALTLTALV